MQEFFGFTNRGFSHEMRWSNDMFSPYFSYFVDLTSKLFRVMCGRELFRLLQKLDTLNGRKLGTTDINEDILILSRLGASFNLSNYVRDNFIRTARAKFDETQVVFEDQYLAVGGVIKTWD